MILCEELKNMIALDVEENSKFKNVPSFLDIYDILYLFFQDGCIIWQDVMWHGADKYSLTQYIVEMQVDFRPYESIFEKFNQSELFSELMSVDVIKYENFDYFAQLCDKTKQAVVVWAVLEYNLNIDRLFEELGDFSNLPDFIISDYIIGNEK